jgi:ABC-2 type transport system ATP-binding protein
MMGSGVTVEGISHRYGQRRALDDVSFSVDAGSLFGLLGPNGGGKTTLFRILSTLVAPTEGRATVAGFDTRRDAARVRRAIGVVFQQTALDDDLTVLENLKFHGALYGLTGGRLSRRVRDLLGHFGLEDRAREPVKTLSGGLKRRVDLVRGLLHNPSVLLLDEPTSGLDPAARYAFWETLSDLRRLERTTLVVATHLLHEADACDVVGILDLGRLVALGSPAGLKSDLGPETLWIESTRPALLRDLILERHGVHAEVIGSRVGISDPEAHTWLAALYEQAGDFIESATVRRPSLEDVFLIRTGHVFGGRPSGNGVVAESSPGVSR